MSNKSEISVSLVFSYVSQKVEMKITKKRTIKSINHTRFVLLFTQYNLNPCADSDLVDSDRNSNFNSILGLFFSGFLR
jgi:hypothetical protein